METQVTKLEPIIDSVSACLTALELTQDLHYQYFTTLYLSEKIHQLLSFSFGFLTPHGDEIIVPVQH